jgi:hypothetical protein
VSVEPAAVSLLRALAPVLEGFGGRWYLFDAQAVVVWGRPRLTGDVDVTAFLEPAASAAFVTAMGHAGFELRVRDVDDFVARTRVLPFTHSASGLALDVVLAGPGLEEEFLRTVRRVDFGGTPVPVIGPEELIVTKILAGRSKDLDDVQGILRSQEATLDAERVRALLRLLEAAIDQADLVPAFEAQLRVARERR